MRKKQKVKLDNANNQEPLGMILQKTLGVDRLCGRPGKGQGVTETITIKGHEPRGKQVGKAVGTNQG